MDSYNGIIILKEPVEKKQSYPASKVAVYVLLASLFVVGAAGVTSVAGGRSYSSVPPVHSSVRGLVVRRLAQSRAWSGWFSDNLDSRRNIHVNGVSTYTQLGRGVGVISGIRCRNDYCDDMQARFEIPERSAGSQVAAFWSSRSTTLSEENGGEYVCPSDHFVSGLHCYGSNCDNIDIRCSQFSNRPRGFCYWENGWFSEEQGEITFRDGYYLAGMRCRSSYCDDKQFYLCHDSDTETTGPANPDDCSILANTDSAVITGFECTGFPCSEGENYKLQCAVPVHYGKTADITRRVEDINREGVINCPNGYLVKSVEEQNGFPILMCARYGNRNAARNQQNTCYFMDELVGGSSRDFRPKSINFESNFYLSGFQCVGFSASTRSFDCTLRRFRVCPLF